MLGRRHKRSILGAGEAQGLYLGGDVLPLQ